MGENCTLIYAIKVRRLKMVVHALRHPEELHNIILEIMIKRNKTRGRPQNSYIGQIKGDTGIKTLKKLKKKRKGEQSIRMEL